MSMSMITIMSTNNTISQKSKQTQIGNVELETWALIMQYRIHVDISTSTRPICTKITGTYLLLFYQPISNHSHKFELNRISGSVEFDVDLDVVVLNNNSLFDSTSSLPICTKITENTYQLIFNHSRKFELDLNQISGRDEFDVDFVALNNNSLFDSIPLDQSAPKSQEIPTYFQSLT